MVSWDEKLLKISLSYYNPNFPDEISGDRVVSQQSTLSDTADSSGGDLIVAASETPTYMMADKMICKVIDIWEDDLPLSFSAPDRSIKSI